MGHHHEHEHSPKHAHGHDHDHDHAHGHSHDHTHAHTHTHTHAHSHEHAHGHAHEKEPAPGNHSHGSLSFEEKMIKLLEHWIKHNDDHADSYRDWAQKARTHDMPAAGELLDEVAELTANITGKFEEILKTIKG